MAYNKVKISFAPALWRVVKKFFSSCFIFARLWRHYQQDKTLFLRIYFRTYEEEKNYFSKSWEMNITNELFSKWCLGSEFWLLFFHVGYTYCLLPASYSACLHRMLFRHTFSCNNCHQCHIFTFCLLVWSKLRKIQCVMKYSNLQSKWFWHIPFKNLFWYVSKICIHDAKRMNLFAPQKNETKFYPSKTKNLQLQEIK